MTMTDRRKVQEQIAKMVLWSSAALSAALFTRDEESTLGRYLMYTSAVVRTAFLLLMFSSQQEEGSARPPEKRLTVYRGSLACEGGLGLMLNNAPRLDAKFERGAQWLLKVQSVYILQKQ
eukprot:TRINITY_DN32404_c0_g1_i3.p1 TRINITY_DN32404_c0_g1~~TRINITY_DN32404_c0_g1_i3.p1  ORF type:complete len:120 (+),score=13.97 TRINITY_DN32404_c0_g1_i3:108-467(+)